MLEELGPYLLVSKLGEGGMAEVFKAVKRGPDDWEKPIALKRILPHLADNEAFLKMLSAEARLQAQLDHPNVVHVLDFFRQEGTYALVMEYVPGRNLRQILNDVRRLEIRLPWEMALHIVTEVLRGLDFAHKRAGPNGPLGIVHRDVSPQNVLISYDGFVKLSDFGIAWANIEREKTESGVLKGKHRYLAPEQLQSRKVDPRTDLFSAAIVLYELLCQRHPFEAESDFETMQKIVRGEFRPSQELAPELPAKIHDALVKALQPDVNARFVDAGDFRKVLLSVQRPKWLSRGTEELASFMSRLYPKAEDRAEPSLEKTPFLVRGASGDLASSPSTSNVSMISGVAEISTRRGAFRPFPRRRGLTWALLGGIALLSAVTVWNWNLPFRGREESARSAPPPPAVETAPVDGLLSVDAPPGTTVYVNGKKIGVTPLTAISLAPATYLILLAPSGKPSRTARATIESGLPLEIRFSDMPATP